MLTRRRFLRRAPAAAAAAALLLHHGRADAMAPFPARTDVTIALLLPAGSDVLRGARFGCGEAVHAARLFRTEFEVIDLSSSSGAAAVVAEAARAGAAAVVGGGTDEAAAELAAATRAARILAVNAAAGAPTLRRCAPLLFHVAPDARTRTALLARAGDAMPGDRIVAWHPSLSRYGAGQLNERFERAHGRGMNEDEWAGWMAVKVVWEAVQRAATTAGPALDDYLTGGAVFDGHKGLPLSFHPTTRQLRQPLYVVRGDTVVTELPAPGLAATTAPAALLDGINDPEAITCTA